MQKLTLRSVMVISFFLNYVGSEEFVSVLRVKNNDKNGETLFISASENDHEAYRRGGPQGTYHNQEGYPSPPHNPNRYPPPDFHHHHHADYPHTTNSWNDQTNFKNNPHSYGPPEFPPGFKHSPEFHSRSGEPFPVERKGKSQEHPTTNYDYINNTINEIPLDVLEKFDMFEVNDLLANYVDGYDEEDQSTMFSSRFGESERSAAVIPRRAGCSTENTTVSLASSEDPTIIYIPKCTKIERCTGCCSHRLLSCQAVETETISVQVVKAKYTGAKKLKFDGKELVPLERHIKCKCNCKIKAEHCSPHQQYRANECGCVCTNTDEERKCYRDIEKKEWDLTTCSCKCRGVFECSTGSTYDHNECRCKTLPKRRYAHFEKRHGYNVENLYVTPLAV